VQASRIIRDEHRSLAAALQGMPYLAGKLRDDRVKPDFEPLDAMVYYIDACPERIHHPKEDEYLFKLLRARCQGAGALLDQLQEEHRMSADKIRALEQTPELPSDGCAESAAFIAAVEAYAAFHWDRTEREEREVLPLAEKKIWRPTMGKRSTQRLPDTPIRYSAKRAARITTSWPSAF
jgi:hemerythrin-like domain-containing protein